MTNWDIADKLKAKGYPIWKTHSILNLFGVAPEVIIDVERQKAYYSLPFYQQRLIEADEYVDTLKPWKEINNNMKINVIKDRLMEDNADPVLIVSPKIYKLITKEAEKTLNDTLGLNK